MTQIVNDVISILEDFKAGKITNKEALNKLDEIHESNRMNLLSGVTGSAEQVLFGPDDMECIDKVIKKLKGENGTRDISYGWLRLDEKRLSENEKKVLEIARAYVSNLDSEKKQIPREALSKEDRSVLHDAAWDSKTFPLISGLAQNLLARSKNEELMEYENDFISKIVKRFDSKELVSFKIIQQDQIYTICIM